MTNLNRIRVVVMGGARVGKSAVTVRYLTKRYIGEYSSSTDFLYRHCVTFDSVTTEVEILDTSKCAAMGCLDEHLRWGEAFVVVYSVCDALSFHDARDLLEKVAAAKLPGYCTTLLLGNKRDLDHSRAPPDRDVVRGRGAPAAARGAAARQAARGRRPAQQRRDQCARGRRRPQRDPDGPGRQASAGRAVGEVLDAGARRGRVLPRGQAPRLPPRARRRRALGEGAHRHQGAGRRLHAGDCRARHSHHHEEGPAGVGARRPHAHHHHGLDDELRGHDAVVHAPDGGLCRPHLVDGHLACRVVGVDASTRDFGVYGNAECRCGRNHCASS
ncbi:ras-like protein 1 isoform X1 [Frankliniella occidentalis]|uniref:small monomeric GTPase n=1 Tax=Frankliniella occidentalis TaxID=133901 RepID=A0A9C6U806_FRAOC|nr:ras-like protein 1 isoform X1 [Frankliniella occidentalis]